MRAAKKSGASTKNKRSRGTPLPLPPAAPLVLAPVHAHINIDRPRSSGSWDKRPMDWIIAQAESAGIDFGREFRGRFSLSIGYVEFWQDAP